MTPPHGPRALDVDEAHARLTGSTHSTDSTDSTDTADTADSTGSIDTTGLTVVDVRTPGEYAAGHLPGALNIPLDRLDSALPALRRLPGGQLLVVCASGARSENACRVLTGHGIQAMTLAGGTQGWTRRGHELHRPAASPRAAWSMERQVRSPRARSCWSVSASDSCTRPGSRCPPVSRAVSSSRRSATPAAWPPCCRSCRTTAHAPPSSMRPWPLWRGAVRHRSPEEVPDGPGDDVLVQAVRAAQRQQPVRHVDQCLGDVPRRQAGQSRSTSTTSAWSAASTAVRGPTSSKGRTVAA